MNSILGEVGSDPLDNPLAPLALGALQRI